MKKFSDHSSPLPMSLQAGRIDAATGASSNDAESVLLWKMDDAEDCDLLQDLIPAGNVKSVKSRPDFVLQMVQRKHLFAVVLAAHPFNDDIRLLKQFLSQMENSPPVVLMLTDCPYPLMSVEREFFAVGNLNDSLPELHDIFQNASAGGYAQGGQLTATIADLTSPQTDPMTRSLVNARSQLNSVILDASRQRIVTLTGEVGTARTLFSKLLLQSSANGATDSNRGDCMTFYAGSGDDRIVSSIQELLNQDHSPSTFVVYDPSQSESYQLASMFDSLQGTDDDGARLVMLCDSDAATCDNRSIHLTALRYQQHIIPEITAGILTSLANRWPENRLAVSNEAMELMNQHPWPGNICQFNLILATAMLECTSNQVQKKSDNEPESGVVLQIDAETIRTLLPQENTSQQSKSSNLQRTWLRDRFSNVCERFSERGYGLPSSIRAALSETLIQNAALVWQPDQQEQAARRAA